VTEGRVIIRLLDISQSRGNMTSTLSLIGSSTEQPPRVVA